MVTFNVSPALSSGQPAEAAQSFPKQIQFRFNGVNLGGPDATVIDFVGTGFTVSRGTGEDINTITVEVT